MEKRQVTLHHPALDNILQYLYDQIRERGIKPIVYSKIITHLNGTSNLATYHNQVDHVSPPNNNRLEISNHYWIEVEGTVIENHKIPVMEFKGWQLQMDSVKIEAKYCSTFESEFDYFWNDLLKTFEQTAQEESQINETQTTRQETGDIIHNEDDNLQIKKSKNGPRWYTLEEKTLAVNEWDNLDRDRYAITLQDWLDRKFPNENGLSRVAVSTFYGWRSKLKKVIVTP